MRSTLRQVDIREKTHPIGVGLSHASNIAGVT